MQAGKVLIVYFLVKGKYVLYTVTCIICSQCIAACIRLVFTMISECRYYSLNTNMKCIVVSPTPCVCTLLGS